MGGPDSSFVVRGASFVVTQDAGRRVLRDIDVLVEGGRIARLGKGLPAAGRRISGKGKLLMPGLVNAHTHIPLTLLRGVADDMLLQDWLGKRIFPLESRMRKGDYEAGAALGCIELIGTGTTCALDFYNRIDVYRPVLERSGLRVFCGENVYDGKIGPSPKLSIAERFLKRNKDGGLVKTVVCPHSIYACSDETLVKCRDLAGKYSSLLQIHASETRKEVADCELSARACRPIELLDRLGMLGPTTSLAHCAWISKSEARLIGKAGASVSHNPVSNMKLATGGVAPLPELRQAGANIALGTDSAVSNNSLDLFGTMKAAALLQKFHRWDASVLPAQEVLDMATLGGARLLGLENEIGSIEPGKSADFILLDLGSVRFRPFTSIVSHLVYSATGDTVTDVFVAGKALKRDGKLRSFDAEREFSIAQKAADGLVSRTPLD